MGGKVEAKKLESLKHQQKSEGKCPFLRDKEKNLKKSLGVIIYTYSFLFSIALFEGL